MLAGGTLDPATDREASSSAGETDPAKSRNCEPHSADHRRAADLLMGPRCVPSLEAKSCRSVNVFRNSSRCLHPLCRR
jgi:hypothetical protein